MTGTKLLLELNGGLLFLGGTGASDQFQAGVKRED